MCTATELAVEKWDKNKKIGTQGAAGCVINILPTF